MSFVVYLQNEKKIKLMIVDSCHFLFEFNDRQNLRFDYTIAIIKQAHKYFRTFVPLVN